MGLDRRAIISCQLNSGCICTERLNLTAEEKERVKGAKVDIVPGKNYWDDWDDFDGWGNGEYGN